MSNVNINKKKAYCCTAAAASNVPCICTECVLGFVFHIHSLIVIEFLMGVICKV